eukprot:gene21914-24250_t
MVRFGDDVKEEKGEKGEQDKEEEEKGKEEKEGVRSAAPLDEVYDAQIKGLLGPKPVNESIVLHLKENTMQCSNADAALKVFCAKHNVVLFLDTLDE